MRTLKFTLLVTSLALFFIHCGGAKPAPDAYKSMAKNKLVRVATNPFNVPFESAAGTSVEGYDVDLADAIVKDLGYPIKWIKTTESYDKMFEYLRNGEVEMVVSSVAITPELEKEFTFSTPYFEGSNTIARRNDNEKIKDLGSLDGKRVGVQTGRIADQFMTNQKTAANVTLSRYQTLDDALGFLNRQQIDAVVGDNQIMTYAIAKNYKTNLITTGVVLQPTQYAVVVRKDETKLLEAINATIARLKNANELQAMHEKWFGMVLTEAKDEQDKLRKTEEMKLAPKTLAVQIIKEAGNAVKLERLDGFNATLSGANGTFTSTAITTNEEGVRGNCRFTAPIPPGEYKFNLSRVGVSQTVVIAKEPKTALTAILTFMKDQRLQIDIR